MRSSFLRRAAPRGVSSFKGRAGTPASHTLALAAQVSLLSASALALALAASIVAPAQAAQATQTAPATKRFDIPAGPLSRVINQFAVEAGVQVSVEAAMTANLNSPGLTGTHSVESGFASLLAGTGLEVVNRGGGEYTLRRAQVQSEAGESVMLSPVTVAGARGDGLPPAYAGGQVARGGQLGVLGNRDFMDTPFNQTSYTAEFMQNQQTRTLADVIEIDPSVAVTATSSTGTESLSIRGFDYDGQSVTFNGLYGLAPAGSMHVVMGAYERVELLKGPSALLNGMAPGGGNVGGAVNIVPKRAEETPILQFTPSYETESQLGGHLDVGRRFGANNQFGVRLNAIYRDGKTAIDSHSRETRLVTLALDYRSDTVRLSADLGHQKQDYTGIRPMVFAVSGLDLPSPPKNTTNWGQSWRSRKGEDNFITARAEVDLSSNLTAYAAAGRGYRYSWQVAHSPQLQDAQGTLLSTTASSNAFYDEKSTIEAGLKGRISTGGIHHEFTVSHNIFRDEFRSSSVSVPYAFISNLYDPVAVPRPVLPGLPDPEDSPKSRQRKNSSATFADTISALDDRIQLTLGMRRQQVRIETFAATGERTSYYKESAWSPAAALVLKPTHYLSLYANYIQGLEPGSVVGADYANEGEVFPPYKSSQYEVGAKFDFGTLAATLSAFQIKQPSTFWNMQNNTLSLDGEQRNRGLELNIFGEAARGLRLLGGMTWLDARVTRSNANEGNRAGGVPRFRATLGMEWDTPFLPGLTLTGRAIHTSSAYVNNDNLLRLPSWTRFDLGARYFTKVGATPVTIRAELRNVFDRSYWERGGLLSTPRTLNVSATFEF